MYHPDTFYFQKNEGVNDWAVEGRIQKAAKKCHEIHQLCTLTSRKNSLKNAMKVGVFLLSSLKFHFCVDAVERCGCVPPRRVGGGGAEVGHKNAFWRLFLHCAENS